MHPAVSLALFHALQRLAAAVRNRDATCRPQEARQAHATQEDDPMPHPTHDEAARAFLEASANLLNAAIEQVRQDTPQAVDYLAAAVRAGAAMQMRATLWQGTGLAQATVEVLEPTGEVHTVAALELQRKAAC